MRTPYIYEYNLNLQRRLGNELTAELNYVGSSSHKLTTQVDENPMIHGTSMRVLNTQAGLQIPDAFGAIVATASAANASYNGLLASLTKRMGDWHSLGPTFFTLSYTWSHEIDDGSGLYRNSSQVPAFNHHLLRASGDTDVRNRLVLSGGWELPFSHMWASGPKRLTSGWSLYPIESHCNRSVWLSNGRCCRPSRSGWWPICAGTVRLGRLEYRAARLDGGRAAAVGPAHG
jgi:hypothetical protein